jgi:hypothetical protein
MDHVHFCSACEALCGASDARWCTILRETVTCPLCRRLIDEQDLERERKERADAVSSALPSLLR